jgi:predicted Zn-dependent protease with MMP-like domain
MRTIERSTAILASYDGENLQRHIQQQGIQRPELIEAIKKALGDKNDTKTENILNDLIGQIVTAVNNKQNPEEQVLNDLSSLFESNKPSAYVIR